MRLLLCVLGALLAPPAFAADPKPNTLTPKEAADGWLLLFDGETAFGWKTVGDVRVADGALRLGGAKEAAADLTTAFGEYDLDLEYRTEEAGRARYRTVPAPGVSFLPTQEPGWGRATFTVRFDGDDQTTEFRFYSPAGTLR